MGQKVAKRTWRRIRVAQRLCQIDVYRVSTLALGSPAHGHHSDTVGLTGTGVTCPTYLSRSICTSSPVGWRSIVMTVAVCLSLCLSAYLWNYSSDLPIFTKCLYMLPVAVARSSVDGVAILYVLPDTHGHHNTSPPLLGGEVITKKNCLND